MKVQIDGSSHDLDASGLGTQQECTADKRVYSMNQRGQEKEKFIGLILLIVN